jgi:hypothetical protein
MGRQKPGKPRRERGQSSPMAPPPPLEETHGLNVKLDVISNQFMASRRSVLESILPDFSQEVINRDDVELVVTNKYEQVVGDYEARSPSQATDSSSQQTYSATKVDGALAAAKTVELPRRKAAVIVPVQLLAAGNGVARRIMLHESQHVRLIQNGEAAWAFHRKTKFARPHELLWEFVWLAESLLDEFRCERALYEEGESNAIGGSVPGDYADLRPLYLAVRKRFQQDGDVMQMYHGALRVLDRVPSILGYGAAEVAATSSENDWVAVPEMMELLDVIREIPSSHEPVAEQKLSETILSVAGLLREWLQREGFDGYITANGGTFFTLV